MEKQAVAALEILVKAFAEAHSTDEDMARVALSILVHADNFNPEKEIASIRENVIESLTDGDKVPTEAEIDEAMPEALEDAMFSLNFEESRRGGNTNEIENYTFATESDAQDIAKEYLESGIDEGIISMDTIKDSWRRGQTMADWIDEAIRMDGLGNFLNSYDGNCEEIKVNNDDWVYWRDH